MTATRSIIATTALFIVCTWLATPAAALVANCRNTGSFDAWLEAFKAEAATKGVGQRGLAALNGIALDPKVISADRGQGVFRQTFEQFSGRMIAPYRVTRGTQLLKKEAALFAKIESEFGVPGPVLVAIWAMETDFGAGNGTFPTIRSLATLAYDCRRSDYFRAELMDALRLVERGDLNPATARGAWAGEIGQTQFMPSSYLKFAVNYGGGRDLIHSSADALASTANYLKSYGWKRGQGWEPGQPNFEVILQWNKAQVYARTIAAFATRLQGLVSQ